MNAKKLIIFLLIGILLCASCSDEEEGLSFDKDYCEVPLRRETKITFSGNANEVKCSDSEVLSVDIKNNYIRIEPKKKGSAQITIKGEGQATINIKVVDAYLCFAVGSPKHDPFGDDYNLYLIGNDCKDFYLYDKKDSVISHGYYDTSIVDKRFHLTLHSNDNTNGEYDISSSSDLILTGYFPLYLGIDWGIDFTNAVSRSPMVFVLKLVNITTNAEHYFVLKEEKLMPYHVLTE